MSETQHWLDGIVDILREALEGGEPGQGTAFVENTGADGVRYGLLPTLARLSAAQASQEVYGTSVAGHTRHTAFHLEVLIRWDHDGERGPFDWKGSPAKRSGRRCSSGCATLTKPSSLLPPRSGMRPRTAT